MPRKIFFIDGHALVFKMYYAFMRRPMVNSKGADMSILYGFTKYVLELLERENPDYLAVAFDPPGGTFRNKIYPEYKANRTETPQLVIDALEPLQELCKAMNIPTLMIMGFEADDVIGSMAKRCAREGLDVYMVTPDKDYGQLIEDHIWQYKPGKGGGENEIVGIKEICEKYGIQSPSQVIDMLTICGDTADNVPGVKGVGEVGAGKLVAKYGSVKGIYDHLDELSPRQKAMFEEAAGHISLSQELVTIKTDIDVSVATEEMKVDRAYGPELADLFEKYEFNSLQRFIGHIAQAPAKEEKNLEVQKVSPTEACKATLKAGICSVISEGAGEGIFSKVRRVIVATPVIPDGSNVILSEAKNLPFIVSEGSVRDFKSILEDPAVAKCGEDLKRQMNILSSEGICLSGKLFDIGLMHYLVDPEKSHKVEVLSQGLLGLSIEAPEAGNEASTGSLFDDIPSEEAFSDRSREAAVLLMLKEILEKELEEKNASGLYWSMEEPLLKVLSRMERNGVRVDIGSLKDYTEHLRSEMTGREAKVRELAGDPSLNVSSPKQIGEVLFEKLKLAAKPKKNANGTYSTDETTLMDIADRHPIVDEILEFRAVKKLLSTYIEPFPGYIDPSDGKVHTTFNQALTATGRLSSSNPNLQNIPIRTDRGREIRKAFVPGTPEGLILSADYSQIELRIMAHLSCDQHLVKAFKEGVDIHAATASKIFSTPHEEVTADQRRIAKTANFGIMYGISAFGLAQRLRIGRKEAQKVIDDYFAGFPSILSFIEDTKAAARETGYVETLFGRRRYIPEINSKNGTIRALAERNAVNAPIQGTSADIIKLAMIAVDKELAEKGFKSKMVLQIHDELVFDAVPDEIEALKAMVVDKMENIVKLSVPLTVECNYGKNWLEAH
ncbi:MAG: DNA polymerase I [Bacteroidales bacterium]|nr:DNA polymerase I [Bacteroidales bacterium]